MSDDYSERGVNDRINLHEPYEVCFWTSKFGCTREQLVQAVSASGATAENVRRYLAGPAPT